MPTWTIAGQASKPWNATALPLADRAIEAASLSFQSLDVDTLTLGIAPEDYTSYTAPELGQIVRLYRNGLLFFTGHVTDVRASVTAQSQSLSVTVSGPWWWMERINYTSTQTDGTGATATRMTGVFGNAAAGTNLQTAIQNAIDQMVVLGVPITNIAGGSSVTSFFQVPRVTLNQGTCAFVMTELCRLVPDTMVYFDYSTTTPTLQVTRRGGATTRTITLGSDEVDTLDINPVWEMKVDQVDLPYIERDAIGRTKYALQTSGTGAAGRKQIITVSGPELDTFLPNDLFDVQPVRTYATLEPFVLASDSQFKTAIDLGLTTQLVINPSATVFTYYTSVSGINQTASARTYTLPATVFTGQDGNTVPITGKVFLTPQQVSDWAISENNLIPVTATGSWAYDFRSKIDYYNPDGSYVRSDVFAAPEWYFSLNSQRLFGGFRGSRSAAESWDLFVAQFTADGYLAPASYHWNGTARTGSNATTIVLATTASAVDDFYIGRTVTWRKSGGAKFTDTITDYVGSTRAATLATSWSTSQRPASGDTYELDGHPLYRAQDYSFIAPPANLAANLLAAQNLVPYEGSIGLTQETAGATRYRGCVVNVANSISEHSTMAALVNTETIDIKNGTTQIGLGTPPRVDYRTFVDRIRKTPQDNIVFDV